MLQDSRKFPHIVKLQISYQCQKCGILFVLVIKCQMLLNATVWVFIWFKVRSPGKLYPSTQSFLVFGCRTLIKTKLTISYNAFLLNCKLNDLTIWYLTDQVFVFSKPILINTLVIVKRYLVGRKLGAALEAIENLPGFRPYSAHLTISTQHYDCDQIVPDKGIINSLDRGVLSSSISTWIDKILFEILILWRFWVLQYNRFPELIFNRGK